MDTFDKFFNVFSLTFLEIALGHSPVDETFTFGFRNIGGTGKGVAAIGSLKVKNSGWARVGLFGAGFGFNVDNSFDGSIYFVDRTIPVIGAEMALKLDATLKNQIAKDLADRIGDFAGAFGLSSSPTPGVSKYAVASSIQMRDSACALRSQLGEQTASWSDALSMVNGSMEIGLW